jgi:multiple RNA-binding domain-containing protein 1
MSRVIVKNIPKEITEIELKNHFLKQGEITDIKIMRNEKGESRKFAFIGFKTVEQAKNTVKYFNNTYVKTCKVQLDEAKVQGDASLNKNKSWSKIKRNEILNKKATDADGKTNVDGDQNGNDKASKINKLLELDKQ